jgi:hypothetical protein
MKSQSRRDFKKFISTKIYKIDNKQFTLILCSQKDAIFCEIYCMISQKDAIFVKNRGDENESKY